MQTVRVGKRSSSFSTISFKDKLDVLRPAKSLKTTGQQVCSSWRTCPKVIVNTGVLVKAMKNPRSEGNRAFIRVSDEKSGAVVDCTSVTLSQDQYTSQ